MVVVQEVGELGDTREGEGEVTGGDQEWAAPSGTFWFTSWPCHYRHQDDSLILGPFKRNQSRHLVQNSKSYHFVDVKFGWFATWAILKFQQTLLSRKRGGILGNQIKR